MPRISANHAHVFPPEINPDGTIERLLELLDACEIEQAVCFAPFPARAQEFGIEPNSWLADQIRGRDRLAGFGTIDFRRSDVADQVQRAAELGFKGLKLHPNGQDFAITSPLAMETYAAAERLGMFITFHSGVHRSRLRDTRVLLFDEVAWNFPNLRFSMEHIGGPHFFFEALAVLFNHLPTPWDARKSNVFGGLASIFSQETNRFWYLGPERLAELIAQIPATQLIFGLDFPFNQEKETRLAIETINQLKLSEEDKARILGGSLRAELKLK